MIFLKIKMLVVERMIKEERGKSRFQSGSGNASLKSVYTLYPNVLKPAPPCPVEPVQLRPGLGTGPGSASNPETH